MRMRCWHFSMEILGADKDGYSLGLVGLFRSKQFVNQARNQRNNLQNLDVFVF